MQETRQHTHSNISQEILEKWVLLVLCCASLCINQPSYIAELIATKIWYLILSLEDNPRNKNQKYISTFKAYHPSLIPLLKEKNNEYGSLIIIHSHKHHREWEYIIINPFQSIKLTIIYQSNVFFKWQWYYNNQRQLCTKWPTKT